MYFGCCPRGSSAPLAGIWQEGEAVRAGDDAREKAFAGGVEIVPILVADIGGGEVGFIVGKDEDVVIRIGAPERGAGGRNGDLSSCLESGGVAGGEHGGVVVVEIMEVRWELAAASW